MQTDPEALPLSSHPQRPPTALRGRFQPLRLSGSQGIWPLPHVHVITPPSCAPDTESMFGSGPQGRVLAWTQLLHRPAQPHPVLPVRYHLLQEGLPLPLFCVSQYASHSCPLSPLQVIRVNRGAKDRGDVSLGQIWDTQEALKHGGYKLELWSRNWAQLIPRRFKKFSEPLFPHVQSGNNDFFLVGLLSFLFFQVFSSKQPIYMAMVDMFQKDD